MFPVFNPTCHHHCVFIIDRLNTEKDWQGKDTRPVLTCYHKHIFACGRRLLTKMLRFLRDAFTGGRHDVSHLSKLVLFQ